MTRGKSLTALIITALLLLLAAFAMPSGEILPAARESNMHSILDDEYSFLLQ